MHRHVLDCRCTTSKSKVIRGNRHIAFIGFDRRSYVTDEVYPKLEECGGPTNPRFADEGVRES
jgi:hypothetical protein